MTPPLTGNYTPKLILSEYCFSTKICEPLTLTVSLKFYLHVVAILFLYLRLLIYEFAPSPRLEQINEFLTDCYFFI